jgi:hypothetical protein
LNVLLPDDVTWTVQFTGLAGTAGDRAGLLFRDPPTVGTSYNDAWRRTDTGWQTVIFQNGAKPANFAARMISDLPRISIRPSTNAVILEWSGPAVLQVADDVAGPYTDLPQFHNRYVVPTRNAPFKFWRLWD